MSAFVELKRTTSGTEQPLFVRPDLVSAVFPAAQQDITIVRLLDGRGFKVNGAYATIRDLFPGLVEFSRIRFRDEYLEEGEDDSAGEIEQPLAVAPKHINAVFPREGGVVLRIADGRGLMVAGDQDDIMHRLNGAILPH